MRNLKKVLALVIAFSMMLSVVAFAGYNDVDADADYASAVELLSALNIFKGDENGNFNPDNTITRAEMAAIICRAKGLEDQAAGSAGATMFADVAADHWASGYINLASQNGIINGYGDGNFGPDDTVTYEQAIKMLVCTLGYEPMAQAKGGWSTGYLVVANTYKITEGAAANATRANLAILVANALETPMMDQTSFGSDEKFERLDGKGGRDYVTLLTGMDIYILTGSVAINANDKTNVTVTLTAESEDDEFNYKYLNGAAQTTTQKVYVGATDIAAYEHQIVNVYVKKDARKDYTALAVVDANVGQTVSFISDDIRNAISAAGDEISYYVDSANSDDHEEIDLALNEIVFNKNTQAVSAAPATKAEIDAALDHDGTAGIDSDLMLTFIDVDGNDVYDKLIITKYDSYRVDSVDTVKSRLGYAGVIRELDYEDKKNTIIIRDMEGNALTLEDLAEDDMIAVTTDRVNGNGAIGAAINTQFTDYIEIVKLDNSAVTGKVDSVWGSNNEYVSINDTDYVTKVPLAVGDEGTFYIGMTGKITYADKTSAVGNYAIILEAGVALSAFGNTWQIKMLTADGVATYDVDKDLANQAAFTTLLSNIDGWNGSTNQVSWVAQSADQDRFVSFDTDSKGLIDELEPATNYGSNDPIAANEEYKERTQKIDGKTLADGVVIFNLDATDADKTFATDLSYLVDEAEYAGYVFKDTQNRENCVMVVVDGESPFNAENGFAVITKTAKSQNEEGDDIYMITYAMGGNDEATIIFTDDSEDEYAAPNATPAVPVKAPSTFRVGDVILFNADADGFVTNYAYVGGFTGSTFTQGSAYADFANDAFGDDVRIATGYLYHIVNKNVTTAYIADRLVITDVDGDGKLTSADTGSIVGYELPAGVNMYTYNDLQPTKVKVNVGDYLATENTEYWTSSITPAQATPVVFVEIDGTIVDIYTANAKAAGANYDRFTNIVD